MVENTYGVRMADVNGLVSVQGGSKISKHLSVTPLASRPAVDNET